VHTACLREVNLFSGGQTQSKVWNIHLSGDYLLGHRIDAQGVRVSGFYTPALQHNRHHLCLHCNVKFTNTANTKQFVSCGDAWPSPFNPSTIFPKSVKLHWVKGVAICRGPRKFSGKQKLVQIRANVPLCKVQPDWTENNRCQSWQGKKQ